MKQAAGAVRFVTGASDVAASAIWILMLVPLLVFAAIAIKLDSRGPVPFRQRLLGRGQINFYTGKYRTLRVGTPELSTRQMLKLPSPVTQVGAILRSTRLDELRQLWNEFNGEMKLVGPLPVPYNQH